MTETTDFFGLLKGLRKLPQYRKYKAFRALVAEFKHELRRDTSGNPYVLLLQNRPVDEFIQVLEAYKPQVVR